MHPPTASPTARSTTSVGEEGRTAFLLRLAEMSSQQRIEAARRGVFNRAQRALWVAAYPDEVPLVNGELEWIALGLADLD
jgi:hypothetical protein